MRFAVHGLAVRQHRSVGEGARVGVLQHEDVVAVGAEEQYVNASSVAAPGVDVQGDVAVRGGAVRLRQQPLVAVVHGRRRWVVLPIPPFKVWGPFYHVLENFVRDLHPARLVPVGVRADDVRVRAVAGHWASQLGVHRVRGQVLSGGVAVLVVVFHPDPVDADLLDGALVPTFAVGVAKDLARLA